MPDPIAGIHHVTSIAGPPQPNVDFYVGVLGLRLVKRTVNFDDPANYHLYFGDGLGRPGTAMTSFPWAHAVRGRAGAGMTVATAFAVPPGSLDFWMGRLADRALDFGAPEERFGERVLPVPDPDGLALELVEREPSLDRPGWPEGPVPAANALRGFDAVTLAVADPAPTVAFLSDVLGYERVGEEAGRQRLRTPVGAHAATVDVVISDVLPRPGAGTVHHVAFRARDEDELLAWQEAVRAAGLHVTDVRDRQYFRSIYFREPGGVLFEIATDGPGFTHDEPAEALGEALRLPPWLEGRRESIEARLVPLRPPAA